MEVSGPYYGPVTALTAGTEHLVLIIQEAESAVLNAARLCLIN
jgi:hypothetical protein